MHARNGDRLQHDFGVGPSDGEMADTNFEYLLESSPLDSGAPTVYDLKQDRLIDIYDNNWFAKLISSV
jgi:hypothetical protein